MEMSRVKYRPKRVFETLKPWLSIQFIILKEQEINTEDSLGC